MRKVDPLSEPNLYAFKLPFSTHRRIVLSETLKYSATCFVVKNSIYLIINFNVRHCQWVSFIIPVFYYLIKDNSKSRVYGRFIGPSIFISPSHLFLLFLLLRFFRGFISHSTTPSLFRESALGFVFYLFLTPTFPQIGLNLTINIDFTITLLLLAHISIFSLMVAL